MTFRQGNILIDDTGVAKICDFGLVRIILEEGESGMTTTSDHTGTDRYLSCELVTTRSATSLSAASDVYALGCIGLNVSISSPNSVYGSLSNRTVSISTNSLCAPEKQLSRGDIPGHQKWYSTRDSS